jgi:hypothetical protein
MNQDTIWQVIRYALIALGGYFTNKGIVSSDQWTTIIGALGTVFPIIWGLYVKYGTKATTIAAAAKPSVPTVSGATGIVTK